MTKQLLRAVAIAVLVVSTLCVAGSNAQYLVRPWFTVENAGGATVTTTASLTLPATIEPGDLLIVYHQAVNTSGLPTDVTPSGFTNIINDSGLSSRVRLDYKIATGSEDGTSVSTVNGNGADGGQAVRIRAVPNRTAGDVGGISSQLAWSTSTGSGVTVSNPAAETVAVSAVAAPVLAICIYAELSSGGSITGVTDGITATFSQNNTLAAPTEAQAHFFVVSSGSQADFTCDLGDGGTNYVRAAWVPLAFK